MNAKLSDAYRVLRDAIVLLNVPNCNVASIEAEIAGADEELLEDEILFEIRLNKLIESVGDPVRLGESLASLRVSAMNISTIFSNLAGDIKSVLIEQSRAACDSVR